MLLKAHKQQWEEMQKLDMPLARVIEDYASDLGIQRRSPKTIYREVWIAGDNHRNASENYIFSQD